MSTRSDNSQSSSAGLPHAQEWGEIAAAGFDRSQESVQLDARAVRTTPRHGAVRVKFARKDTETRFVRAKWTLLPKRRPRVPPPKYEIKHPQRDFISQARASRFLEEAVAQASAAGIEVIVYDQKDKLGSQPLLQTLSKLQEPQEHADHWFLAARDHAGRGSSYSLAKFKEALNSRLQFSLEAGMKVAKSPVSVLINDESTSSDIASHSTSIETTTAYAMARIKEQLANEALSVGRSYVLQAALHDGSVDDTSGLLEEGNVSFPSFAQSVQVDALAYAEDMEIQPAGRMQSMFLGGDDASPAEFHLTPLESGTKRVRVEFVYQQRWLAQVEFNVEVIDET